MNIINSLFRIQIFKFITLRVNTFTMSIIGTSRTTRSSAGVTNRTEESLEVGETIEGEPITEDRLIVEFVKVGDRLRSLKVSSAVTLECPSLFELLANFCPNLNKIEISALTNVDLAKLHHFTSKCKKVVHFAIEDHDGIFKDEHLLLVLSSLWKLEFLKLIGASVTKSALNLLPSSLTYLDLRSCKFITLHAFNIIRKRCPLLKFLYTALCFDQPKLDDLGYHWPQLEACIVSTKTLLNFKKLDCLKELFLHCTVRGVSLNSIVNELRQLCKLQLDIVSAKDEVLYFGCDLKTLVIKSDEPLSHNIVLSLPYCSKLEVLDVRGTDIRAIVEELMEKCNSLRYLQALDTEVDYESFSRLMIKAKLDRKIVVDLSLRT